MSPRHLFVCLFVASLLAAGVGGSVFAQGEAPGDKAAGLTKASAGEGAKLAKGEEQTDKGSANLLRVEVRAARVEALSRAEGDQVVVYQGDEREDVRVEGTRTVVKNGRPSTQRFVVRAEGVVAFLAPISPSEKLVGFPVAGLYARGFVRVEVQLGEKGGYVLEADEVYFNFRRERAALSQGILRSTGGAKGQAGVLGASRFVIAAGAMRLAGSTSLVAEDASVTVCDYTKPLWALAADRVEVSPSDPPEPLPAALAALGGITGASSAGLQGGRGRLLTGLLNAKEQGFRTQAWTPVAGSDSLRRAIVPTYELRAEGVHMRLLPPGFGLEEPLETPRIPFLGWDTAWPLPQVKVGSSSRFGTFASLGLKYELARLRHRAFGELRLGGEGQLDYYERRGTAGDVGVTWSRSDAEGRRGEGHLRAFGIRDRARQDRVGTTIRNEGRFWLRGLVREKFAPDAPGDVQLDAEVSRVSDPGVLLEYYRSVAQTEKEQETYAYARAAWDDLGVRLIARPRINDWQTQVERTPEARLDWILHPIAVSPRWGGLYLDTSMRGGHLRFRPENASGRSSYRAWRGDFQSTLEAKTSLGPFQVRGYAGLRETLWSDRADERHSIDRFAGLAGWNVSTVLWKTFSTPWGVLRHEIVPEAGTRHVFGVTRDPNALLAFDEVEELQPTDQVFLRLRTRLLTDVNARRRKLLDFSVEGVYLIRDQGRDKGRSWLHLRYDLRLGLARWLGIRARAEQDVNTGGLRDLNAQATFRPGFLGGAFEGLSATVGYREVFGARVKVEAMDWGLQWRLTPAWAITLEQQYDFFSGDFLRHSGQVIRYFQGFALQAQISHDPQQDDTSVSFSFSPVLDALTDPFLADRTSELYPD